jgi:Tropinone reductase 1
MDDAWRLDGQTALITGASRGLGRATAIELAGLGARLLLVARGREDLEHVAGLVRERVPHCETSWVTADLAAEAGRDAVVDAAAGFGALNILVNNVGFNIRKPMTEISLDEYRSVHETNTVTCFEMSRRLFPLLRAMIQLTRNLAVEWARYEIRVNAVAPWYIDTPLARQVLDDDQYLAEVLDRTPMGRVGEPEEVARTVAFLCLKGAGYITGQCLAIDGGFSVYGF